MAAAEIKQSRSYEHVNGLQEVYIGLGSIPCASFVFETAVQADACRKAISD